MNLEALAIAAVGIGALLIYKARSAKRDELAAGTVQGLKGAPPNVSISNVEAIEERRVFVFQPQVDETLAAPFTSEGGFKQPGTRNPSKILDLPLESIGGSAAPKAFFKRAWVVNLLDGEKMPLVPGAYYSAVPRMGTLPFSDLRLRIEWAEPQPFSRVQPDPWLDCVMTTIIDGDVWANWWRVKIATVGEQVAVGGVFEVPEAFL